MQTFRLGTLLKRDSNTGVFLLRNFCETPILKNIYLPLLFNWLYKVIVWNFVSEQSLPKLSWLSNITKMPVTFKPELSHNSPHMPSLYLIPIPTLSFEPAIPHINFETNPPPPILNVVCKYLRQFLGTSFRVATLPICCNIE